MPLQRQRLLRLQPVAMQANIPLSTTVSPVVLIYSLPLEVQVTILQFVKEHRVELYWVQGSHPLLSLVRFQVHFIPTLIQMLHVALMLRVIHHRYLVQVVLRVSPLLQLLSHPALPTTA